MKYASIFDFDDTLFCTTHVTQSYIHTPDYTRLSHLVAQLLEYAKKKGAVFIVTNADVAWVEQAIQYLTKDAIQAFRGANIYSTVNTGIAATVPFDKRKTVAFIRLYPVLHGRQGSHVICLGDSIYDRMASIALRNKGGGEIFVKSLKLLDEPNCALLIGQLELFLRNIDDFYSYEGQIDCFTSDSAKAIYSYIIPSSEAGGFWE